MGSSVKAAARTSVEIRRAPRPVLSAVVVMRARKVLGVVDGRKETPACRQVRAISER